MTRQQTHARKLLWLMVSHQMEGKAFTRETTLAMVSAMGGCASSADKLLIDGRNGEVGVYLLTLIFDNLKPKQ